MNHECCLNADIIPGVVSPIKIRHMVGVVRATLALPGHKEAQDEAQDEGGHAGGRHGHRELLGAVAA